MEAIFQQCKFLVAPPIILFSMFLPHQEKKWQLLFFIVKVLFIY
jgi:hypothetical protein